LPSVLNAAHRKALSDRVLGLTPSAARKWGRMSVDAMLAHLCLSARMALGELPVASKNMRAFQVFPLKHLVLYVLPFPKGAPTARELIPVELGPFEAQQKTLGELIERLGTGPDAGMGPEHPLFGRLSRREWGALVYKHSDHHLSQFGA
jgi:hypothetical protein